MNACALSGNLYRAAYDAVHPTNENGKRVTRCKGNSLPVLNHILLTDNEGRLALYTHDLETPSVEYSPARIDESFSICVPAHPFLDWLEIIKKDNCRVELTMDADSCLLIVKAQNARATFKCLDAQEFPSIKAARENTEKDPTLASVGLAVSKDDERPQLHKVCHRDGLMIGADAFRLHLAPSDKTEIPEGFPDVNPILDTLKDPQNTVIVPAASLMRAVKSLKAICKQGDGWIRFHSNGCLEVSAVSEEVGTSRAEVEIMNSTGTVAFSLECSYVLDALTHVTPKVKNAKRAGLLPQTVTLYVTKNNTNGGGLVWFVNGDLKAAIMTRREIQEGTAKPTKSELMSAYNRARAQLRREGRSNDVWELNQAFGNLQRKNWQAVAPESPRTYALLTTILETRAAHCLAIVPMKSEVPS